MCLSIFHLRKLFSSVCWVTLRIIFFLREERAMASSLGATSGTDRGFAAFLKSLPAVRPGEKRVRVFARDGMAFFTCYGEEARWIAREFYKTETVVKECGGFPSVSMAFNLFLRRVLPGLLEENAVVELWEQPQGGGVGQWVLGKTGSPGNTKAFEDMMLRAGGSGGGGGGEEDPLLGTGVMMAVEVRGAVDKALTIAVAYVNSSFQTLGLCEFEDTADLKNLEAVTVQIGARECIVAEDKDGGAQEFQAAAVQDVMKRCHVMCTFKSRGCFRSGGAVGGGGGVMDHLKALTEGEGGATSMTAKPWESEHGVLLEQASGMKQGLGCLSVLIDHLALLDDLGNRGTFTLTIFHLADYLHYDASASRAMSVFPEARAEVYRPSVAGQQHQEAGGGGGGGGGGADGEVTRKAQLSLFGLLNRTRTPGGARCLKRWLLQPLVKEADIAARQSIVAELVQNRGVATSLADNYGKGSRGELSLGRGTPDLERTAQKFLSSKAKTRATLQDLLDTYMATLTLDRLRKTLQKHLSQEEEEGSGGGEQGEEEGKRHLEDRLAKPLDKVVSAFRKYQALVEEVVDIDRIIASHGRQVAVKPSFDEELSRLRVELDETKRKMEAVAAAMAKSIKVEASRVKLEYSTVYGHHLRVTKKDQALLKKTSSTTTTSWQTLTVQKTGMLFTTPELRRLSGNWDASSKAYEAAQDAIVAQAVEVARTYIAPMQEGGRVLSALDAMLSLAQVAATLNWCRPRILSPRQQQQHTTTPTPGGAVIRAKALRHPVVEASLSSSTSYIPNDVTLTGLSLITGPNCGGKSTYIRSVGVAVLLAQVGSFVPADDMEWTPVDRILARVGASDSQTRGVSTFMAEMLETRAILDTATSKSLVIIDELGRGTSTADGFGIAWAVASRLASSLGSLTLFATHFHELTELENRMPSRVSNYHTTAEVTGDRLTLLYQIQQGPTDRSFGVNAARVARFPLEVINEAEARVEELQVLGHKVLPPPPPSITTSSTGHGVDGTVIIEAGGQEAAGEARGGREGEAGPPDEDTATGMKKRKLPLVSGQQQQQEEDQTRKKEKRVGGDGDGSKKTTIQAREKVVMMMRQLKALVSLPLEDLPVDQALEAFTNAWQDQQPQEEEATKS